MERKFIKFTGIFNTIACILLLMLSICFAVGLSAMIFQVDSLELFMSIFAYDVIIIITPIIDGIFGELLYSGTRLNTIGYCVYYGIVVLLIIIIICFLICSIKTIKASKKQGNALYNRKKHSIVFNIFALLLGAVIGYILVKTIESRLIFESIAISYNLPSPFFVIKHSIVIGLLVLMILFNIIAFSKIHKRTENEMRNDSDEIYFYSKMYEQKNSQIKDVKTKKPPVIKDIKETKPQAIGLIETIRQLDELKEKGQLSEVEYTKLRQRAIRKYNG